MSVAVGDEAVFRCQHTGAELIGWNINGTSFGSQRSVNITAVSDPLPGGGVLHTLTISALPVYNSTIVSCIAGAFDSGSARERTPDATLFIQGWESWMLYVVITH